MEAGGMVNGEGGGLVGREAGKWGGSCRVGREAGG